MVSYTYDYSFLLKTLKYIFLPILAIVAIVGFIVFMYSRRTKKDNIEKYNYIIDLWTTLLAIAIIGGLFAVTLGFSLSLTNTIRSYDLIKGHEVVYYIVLSTPVVPLIFLFIYLYRFIVTVYNKPKTEEKNENKQESEETQKTEEYKEKYDVDYDIDFTKFNETEEVNKEPEVEESHEDNIEEIHGEDDEEVHEESIHIDDLPDKVVETSQDDIELL